MTAPTLHEIAALGQKGANEPFALGRLYGSRLSRYVTWLLVRTPITPDGVTAVGVAAGIAAGLLLVIPLGPVHLLTVVLYQASYVLDFSDGEVARLRGRSSQAGSYLDWLGHFYVPTLGAGLLGYQLGIEAGVPWVLAGLFSAVGLSAFHFSCKEHIVVAFLRRHPEDVGHPVVRNALLDHPRTPERTGGADDRPGSTGTVLPRRRPPVLSFLGALLFYPGAMHLLSLAVVADLLLGVIAGSTSAVARQALLLAWVGGFAVHGVLAVRRNYRVLAALDGLHGHELPWATSRPDEEAAPPS